MSEILFKFVGEFPQPIFDTDHLGYVRKADGKEIFNLRQAARKTGRPATELRELFNVALGELMPPPLPESALMSEPVPQADPDEQLLGEYVPDRLALAAFKRLFCKGFDDEHIADAIVYCRALKRDPWKNEIRFNVVMTKHGKLEMVPILDPLSIAMFIDRD